MTRLALWVSFSGNDRHFLEPDSPSYIKPAITLLEKQMFLTGEEGSYKPNTFRTPGFTLWIALIFAVSGEKPSILVLSQFILFLGTLFLTFKLAQKTFGPRAGFIAAVLIFLDPPSFVLSFKILTETLSTFLNTLFVLALYFYCQNNGRGYHPLAVGLILTAATFVRPATYYYLPILMVFLALFHFRQKTDLRATLVKIIILALPFVLLVGGWQLRNYSVAGTFQFETQKGMALLYGKGAHILSMKEKLGRETSMDKIENDLLETHPEIRSMTQPEADKLRYQEARKIILDNPWLAVKTQISGLLNYFLEPGTTSSLFRLFNPDFSIKEFAWSNKKEEYFSEIIQTHPAFLFSLIIGMCFLLSLYFLVLYNLWQIPWTTLSNNIFWWHLSILIFIAYLANIYALGSGYSRYRVVLMPLICIYASGGLDKFLTRIKKNHDIM
jgi:4-amino-4-deoxy-L-arabinose transferase-like glycosyltransferase